MEWSGGPRTYTFSLFRKNASDDRKHLRGSNMKTRSSKLPPVWVTLFAWLFLVFLFVPILSVLQLSGFAPNVGVHAFGLNLLPGRDSLAWILTIQGLLFLASLTALFVVTRRSWAYDFGMSYCIVALTITIAGHMLGVGDDSSRTINIAVQYPLLVCLLVHLLYNRQAWRESFVQAEATRPLPLTHG